MRKYTFFLLCCLVLFVKGYGQQPQNQPIEISEIQVYDLGNGSGLIEARLSGPGGNSVTGGDFVIQSSSDSRFFSSGIMILDRPSAGPGPQGTILVGRFPYTAPQPVNGNSQADHVNVTVSLRGMPLTKSKENSSVKTFQY